MGAEEARRLAQTDFADTEDHNVPSNRANAQGTRVLRENDEASFLKIDVSASTNAGARQTMSPSQRKYNMHAPSSPKDPNFKRKRTIRRSSVATQSGSKTENKPLSCPRCGKEGFEDVRALGKHAISCKAKSDSPADASKNLRSLGNDRMAKLMHIKRMQQQHEENEKSKEEQERIEREMQLIIKMERARAERDEILQKQRQVQEQERLVREAEEAKTRQEKEALEKQIQARAEQLMVDSDSDDDNDDDATAAAERRRQLAEKLALKKQGNAKSSNKVHSHSSPQSQNILPKTEGKTQAHAISAQITASTSDYTQPHRETGEVIPLNEEVDWLASPYENEGYTAAHMAAYYNDAAHMLKVIELGGDILSPDPEGKTPLHICALYAHNDCLELLVQKLKMIPGGLSTLDNEGMSALMYAACVDNFTGVAMLADANESILEKADYNGDTALHYAAYYGYKDIVVLLLQLGADPDGPPNNENKSPAVMCMNAEILDLLVSHGADYYGIDNNGRSILFAACATGLIDVVKYLVDINPLESDDAQNLLNYADFRGDTPLHAAACNGHAECVKLLLDKGAKTNILNHAQLSAATLAICVEQRECSAIFKEHGIEAQDLDAEWEVADPNAPEHWQTYTDVDSGYDYYYNKYTGETTWENPYPEVLSSS